MESRPTGGKKNYFRLLKFQLAATILFPLLFIAMGVSAVQSALIGGAIALTATSLQAIKFFRPYRAQNPGALLTNMLLTEASKLVTVSALFAVVFIGLKWIDPLPMFTGFIVFYLTPYVMAATQRSPASNQY